ETRSRVLILLGHLAKLPRMSKLEGQTKRRLTAQARVIKALAHPTRLFLVEELSREERCVCELAEMVGSDMSTVSKHLALLRQAGIVQDDKRGKKVFYRLRMNCALDFTSCASAILEETSRRRLEAIAN
ncbi:MAG: metalloregulator ArsR/SmtB family transcription factor, partial [Thermoanaerobaculia bacterium]